MHMIQEINRINWKHLSAPKAMRLGLARFGTMSSMTGVLACRATGCRAAGGIVKAKELPLEGTVFTVIPCS